MWSGCSPSCTTAGGSTRGPTPTTAPRAAEFARTLRGRLFDLTDHEFGLLHRACAGHTHERTHPDVTIRTCWDADRLDLGRVGISPHPKYLGTEVARRPATIKWADGRASFGVVPEIVWEDWGIDLEAGEADAIERPAGGAECLSKR